jgi:TolB-like protein/Flp pilus assembly protein TadD
LTENKEMSGLIQELKRRNVFKVGAAYVVLAWLLAQVTDIFLEPFGAPDWVIKTVLLVLLIGFPLALFFAWAFELTPEGIKKERDVDRSQSITTQTGRKLDFVIIFVLIMGLGYFAYDKFVLEAERSAAAASTVAEAESATPEPETVDRSIAVLPFVNMSDDKGNEYFSDGISEEILNALAKVKELKVAGRTSSFAFKGKNQDLRQIGDALGVEHILEGSVRKSGTKIRITAQLIQVDDGFHLWSDSYDRELNDVFAIQDEIASAILVQLKAHLLEEEPQISSVRTNSEAYDLYLLSRQRMYERSGPNIQDAAELLDRAIALDPEYAPAYAQRGIATLLLSAGEGSYGDIPREQAAAQASLYLEKALQLDPDLAEAWAGMGLYYLQLPTGNRQAIDALNRALELNPNLINASNWLHNSLAQVGRPADALHVVMDMIDRDPLYRPGIRNAINNFNSFGRYQEAWAHLEKIKPLIPNDATVKSSAAAIHLAQGNLAESLSENVASVALQPSNSVARLTLGQGLMSTGQYERVVEMGEFWWPIYALVFLDRTEEAAILAYRRADEQADVENLFTFLNMTGRSQELIDYLEGRWTNLDALQHDFPSYGGLGYFLMIDVALAYSRAGNQERFNDAITRVREVHEGLKSIGISNAVFFMNEASHLALTDQLDSSMDYLDRAMDLGFTTNTRMKLEWPALEPLEGNPRFEAIQARMLEHLNAERAKLDLEPMST